MNSSTKNLLVYRSSAGSGKTFTLVKEYLKLILADPKPGAYRHVLAITFTNKATSEMKERVLDSLKGISEKKEDTLTSLLAKDLGISKISLAERAKNSLNHILHNYSDISILTIDKFVYKVARSFFMELGLSHNLSIELDGNSILEIAVDAFLEKIGKDPQLTQYISEYLNKTVKKERNWNIEGILLERSSLLLDEKSAHFLDLNQGLSFERLQEISSFLQDSILGFETAFNVLVNKGHNLCKNIEASSFKGGKTRSIKAYFVKVKKLGQGFSTQSILPSSTLQEQALEGIFHSPKSDTNQQKEIQEISAELQGIIQAIIDLEKEKGQDYTLHSLLEQSLFPMYLLSGIKAELDKAYENEKILHLSEFGKKIARIINEEPVPFIYERVGEKYKHFLLDEFQDTSALQWHNMLPLIDESLAKGQLNLLVGDGKQAIYRWRGGEVTQFTDLPELQQGESIGKKASEYQRGIRHNFNEQNLTSNWRSAPEIVNFNNALFEHLKAVLPPHLSDIYKEQTQEPESKKKGFVSIARIDKSENKHQVFQTILSCLDDGYHLQDITILSRNNKELVELSVYLSAQGIAVQSSESLLLKDNPLVKLLLAYLAFCALPSSKDRKAALVQQISVFKEIDWKLSSALIHEEQLLENYLNDSFKLQLSSLKDYSLYEQVVRVASAFDEHYIQNSFVTAFLDLVFHYQTKYIPSLEGWLTFWGNKGDKSSVQSDDNSQAVKLMTIHKSKGLEFPVVIIPTLDWKLSTGNRVPYTWVPNQDEKLAPLKALLLPLKKELANTKYAAYYDKEQEENLLDNINLLYVALTRASVRLYGFYHKNGDIMAQVEPFLQQSERWNEQNAKYQNGVAFKVEEKQEPTGQSLIPTFKKGNWREKIALSYDHEKALIEKHTGYGTLLHNLLANIYTLDDVQLVIDNAIKGGLIPVDLIEKVRENIVNIVTHPDLTQYFKGNLNVKNEYAFLSVAGEVLRADKIVFTEDSATVIDYKTGNKNKKHLVQIKEYADAFLQMGYAKVEGILFYTESGELLRV